MKYMIATGVGLFILLMSTAISADTALPSYLVVRDSGEVMACTMPNEKGDILCWSISGTPAQKCKPFYEVGEVLVCEAIEL
jgi:hypothetical protein